MKILLAAALGASLAPQAFGQTGAVVFRTPFGMPAPAPLIGPVSAPQALAQAAPASWHPASQGPALAAGAKVVAQSIGNRLDDRRRESASRNKAVSLALAQADKKTREIFPNTAFDKPTLVPTAFEVLRYVLQKVRGPSATGLGDADDFGAIRGVLMVLRNEPELISIRVTHTVRYAGSSQSYHRDLTLAGNERSGYRLFLRAGPGLAPSAAEEVRVTDALVRATPHWVSFSDARGGGWPALEINRDGKLVYGDSGFNWRPRLEF